jgi:uncharacterized repeat protein (TIGR03803 family)
VGAVLPIVITVILLLLPCAWAASKHKTLYKFTGGLDGNTPAGDLIFDAAGNLYGTTALGGNGYGVVFKLAPTASGRWRQTVLYRFKGGNDGEHPVAGLVFDTAGNLYGTTAGNGPTNLGTVFRLASNPDGSWTEKVLHRFRGGKDGGHPLGGMILDASGNFYGTTFVGGNGAPGGGGTVFELARKPGGGWKEKVIYSFKWNSDGLWPAAGLVRDSRGNLYGTTDFGGIGDHGAVFKLRPTADGSWQEEVIYSFQGAPDGSQPVASLIFDQAGKLYGTTQWGGTISPNSGVVFQLTPNQAGDDWSESILYTFCPDDEGICPDGEQPLANLAIDATGNLYGTTWWGGYFRDCQQIGDNGCGVVFKLAPNLTGAWKETVVWAFQDDPGAVPFAGPTFDAAGNLYGTTGGDGSTTFGSVFEITP